jgi:hypothetical protein
MHTLRDHGVDLPLLDDARRRCAVGRAGNLARTAPQCVNSPTSSVGCPRATSKLVGQDGFISCNVALGEPNSNRVNNLCPVVDGFPALLPGSETARKATVSQRLRVPAASCAILKFEDEGSGPQPKPSGSRPNPTYSPSGFSHSQVNRGVWLTGCFACGPSETPNPSRARSSLPQCGLLLSRVGLGRLAYCRKRVPQMRLFRQSDTAFRVVNSHSAPAGGNQHNAAALIRTLQGAGYQIARR